MVDQVVGERTRLERLSCHLDRMVVTVAVVLTALGATSVVLARIGQMRPVPLIVLGGAASWALLRLVRGVRPTGERGTGPALVHIALVVGVALLAVVNASMASEHLLGDSDPGIYANAARYLADTGGLLLDPAGTPFDELGWLEAVGGGQYDTGRGEGQVYFQFFHFLSGLMAIGGWIGGNLLLLRLPALLAGLAVLLFHQLARRFAGTGVALGVTLAMALNPVQTFFSRDSYSEVTSQLLVLLGLVLLIQSIDRHNSDGFVVAGLVLGVTAFSRIDAVLLTLPAAVIGVAMLHRSQGAERRDGWRYLTALSVTCTIGFVLGRSLSPVYWDHLTGLLYPMMAFQVIVTLGGVAWLAVGPRITRLVPRATRERWWRRLGIVAATLVGAGATFALYVRPRVLLGRFGEDWPLVANELAEVGLEPDGTRNLAELSLQWVTWYIGAPAVLLGLVGLSIAAWRAISGSDKVMLVLAAMTGVSLVVRVIRPSVVPIHYWAMRRFYVIIIPGLLLLAAWVIARLIARTDHSAAKAAIAAGFVIPTLAIIGTVQIDSWDHRMQIGFRTSVVDVVCDDDVEQAFLLVDHTSGVTSAANYVGFFQTFCASPAQWSPVPLTLGETVSQGSAWAAEGAELVLVSTNFDHLGTLTPPGCGISEARVVNPDVPEATILTPPIDSVTQVIPFYWATVTPACS